MKCRTLVATLFKPIVLKRNLSYTHKNCNVKINRMKYKQKLPLFEKSNVFLTEIFHPKIPFEQSKVQPKNI